MGRVNTPDVKIAELAGSQWFPARDYVDEFASACNRAMQTTGEDVHDLRLGGGLVRLRFAGLGLLPYVLSAFEHLRTSAAVGERPVLTVEMWDGASTGVLPPPFPLRGGDAPVRGETRIYPDAGVSVLFHGGVQPRDGTFEAITIFDERSSVARYFLTAPDSMAWYERAAPLRGVLHWGLARPDRLLVHAGAVGIGGTGVLLAGPAGSGKSTTAVASLLAGHDYLGDDYVLVDMAASRPVAHSLYATAKLTPAATALLPRLPDTYRGRPPHDAKKHVVDISRLRPNGVRTSTSVAAIVLPRLCPGVATGVRPASATAALLALAPTTVFQAPRHDGAALRPLAELARRVPAYVLDLGGSPEEVGPVLAQLLQSDGLRSEA
jgi:hypothetical protein